MESKYSAYISFLMKYRDELAAFLEIECEKRRALLGKDLSRLENTLKVQQAEIMKFRSLESKRLELQSKLGLPDTKAAELLELIDDAEACGSIKALLAEMADTAAQIQEQNRQSLDLAESNLKILDLIQSGGEAEMRGQSYGPENGRRKSYSAGETFEETV